MEEQLESKLRKICDLMKENFNKNITNSEAFELFMCILYCLEDIDINKLDDSAIAEALDLITNGPNDGGIDFVYFDDDSSKVIVGQCKFVNKFNQNELISELNKMSTTIENFKNRQTGLYNEELRKKLQNALDSLPVDDEYNIEYKVFVSCNIDIESYYNKVENEENIYTKGMVKILSLSEIISKIRERIEDINLIPEYKITIDKAKNILNYSNGNQEGIMVNISNHSLIDMYNKYKDHGLFDLNIRKYIRSKEVDNKIKDTLNKDRKNFWFLNNGITIACKEFDIDGNKIHLYDFSIVNGGQTTTLIGNYKGKNREEFFISCKIIADKNGNDQKFYNKVAEATNSQKPITARDLKSNSPEMRQLKNWLSDNGVNLEIKRGEIDRKSKSQIKIKNDELGQIILSFIYQQPGTARSGKKDIFEKNTLYNKIYRKNYEKDINKKNFLIDLIKLYKHYEEIEAYLKSPKSELNENERDILKNGKCMIFSIFGLLYRDINKDLKLNELSQIKVKDIVDEKEFLYGSFVSNYAKDDYHNKLENMIIKILRILDKGYAMNKRYSSNDITSVSNYFKTDSKYYELIIPEFISTLQIYGREYYDDLLKISEIFCRS